MRSHCPLFDPSVDLFARLGRELASARGPLQIVATGGAFTESLCAAVRSPSVGRVDVFDAQTGGGVLASHIHVHGRDAVRGIWHYPHGIDVLHTQSLRCRIDVLCLGSAASGHMRELAAALPKLQPGSLVAVHGPVGDASELLNAIGARCLYMSLHREPLGGIWRMPGETASAWLS